MMAFGVSLRRHQTLSSPWGGWTLPIRYSQFASVLPFILARPLLSSAQPPMVWGSYFCECLVQRGRIRLSRLFLYYLKKDVLYPLVSVVYYWSHFRFIHCSDCHRFSLMLLHAPWWWCSYTLCDGAYPKGGSMALMYFFFVFSAAQFALGSFSLSVSCSKCLLIRLFICWPVLPVVLATIYYPLGPLYGCWLHCLWCPVSLLSLFPPIF